MVALDEPGKPSSDELTYLIAQKGPVLVVSFVGPLNSSNIMVIQNCTEEILNAKADWVILNFREVPSRIENKILPPLAKLQQAIREKPATLRIIGLKKDLFQIFTDKGILHHEEVANNIADVIEELPVSKK